MSRLVDVAVMIKFKIKYYYCIMTSLRDFAADLKKELKTVLFPTLFVCNNDKFNFRKRFLSF